MYVLTFDPFAYLGNMNAYLSALVADYARSAYPRPLVINGQFSSAFLVIKAFRNISPFFSNYSGSRCLL
jgi:hypothetical protein